MSQPRPSYIGVSGVTSPLHQALLVTQAAHRGINGAHFPRLLLGVKATHKTLMLDVANKYGVDWYPRASSMGDALVDESALGHPAATMRTAQVYAEPHLIASRPGYLTSFCAELIKRTKPWLTDVQFDMLPFDSSDPAVRAEVAAVLADLAGRDLGVLVQVHGPAMNRLGPAGCVEALSPHAAHLTHVLFDSSHGTGTRLDTDALAPFLAAAAASPDLAGLGLGVAGGLDAHTVPELAPLLEAHPYLSWDAESRLHPVATPVPRGPFAAPEPLDDSDAPAPYRPLNHARALAYLDASADLLGLPGMPRLPAHRYGPEHDEASR